MDILKDAYFNLSKADEVDLELLEKFLPEYKDMNDTEILEFLKNRYIGIEKKIDKLEKEVGALANDILYRVSTLIAPRYKFTEMLVQNHALVLSDKVMRKQDLEFRIEKLEDYGILRLSHLLYV